MRKKPRRHRLRKLSLENLEGRRLLAQMVASPSSQTVDVNDAFTISTNYSTLPAETTTGVSLRLHYNANLVSFDVNDITLGAGVPPTQGSPFIGDDTTEDGDNDPTTDMFVQVDFIDFSGTFPAELTPLFDAMFTATAVGTANFNYSFRNATGATSSTPATVTIESAAAGQIVTATPATQTVDVNDTFTVSTNYSTIPAMQTTGVSLRLHYNANLVSFDVNDITLGAGVPPTQGSPFIGDDTTEDGDNDPTTDMFVQVDFIDFSGTFPAELTPLFDAMFTATAVGTANFNYSFRNATGATSSTPATVTIESAAAGQIVTATPATQTVDVNDTFTVSTNYSTIPAMQTTGVSLRLHYNANLVSFDVNDITLGAGVPPTQGSPFIGDDTTEDGDNDPTTDMFVQVDFIDFSGTFPAELTPLFDAMFTATTVGTANFNYSFRNATGATNSTSATVTINEVVPTVSVAVSPDSVAEDGTDALTYTFTRSGDASEALSVSYTVGGTASEGTDFPTQTGTVTIDANQTTATLTIDPTDDTDVELDETIILTVTNGVNYDVGTPSSATGTIIDDDVITPTVSVAVDPTSVIEDGTDALTYTFTRAGDASEALTVSYTIGGTASAGTDFPTQTGSVTIDANQTTATLTIDPTDDTDVELDETIILTVTNGVNYDVGTPSSATGTIIDDDVITPTVSVAVDPTSVIEDGTDALTYTFTRAGDASEALTVSYTIGGTASEGTDFPTQTGSVTIDANQTTATLTIDPTDDTVVELDETIILTVTNGVNYDVGTPSSATGTIIDDDVITPTVSVAVSPASVNEDGTDALTYTFTRSGNDTEALSVSYTVGGTATEGNDFPIQSGTVTIGANQTTGTVTIDPTDDTDVELDETIILTVTDGSNYDIGVPSSATGTIINDDAPPLPTVSVSVDPSSVLEDGTINLTYTFTRTGGDTTQPLTVNYTTGGTATEGTDYTGTSTSVVILANQTQATVTVDPTADIIDEPDETVILTITPNSGVYNVGTSPATGTIIDDDPPPSGGTRFLSPRLVARPYLIPGDGLPTAVLFRADTNTTLTVGQVGVASLTEEVRLLDQDLNSVGGQSSGVYNADLLAGNLYALIFMARSTDSTFIVRSSAGYESLSGASSTNLLQRTDVNADGESTVLDALLIVNQLSRQSGGKGEGEEISSLVQTGRFYDVNRDGDVTPGDALRVINELARQNVAGEGEQLAASVAHEKVCLASTGTTDQGLGVGVVATSAGDEPLMAAASMGPIRVNQPQLVVDRDAAEETLRSVDESLSDESFLEQLAFA